MRRPLVVHVERLVLDEAVLGDLRLDARGRSALRAALQAELAARLAEGNLQRLSSGGALADLRAGELQLPRGIDAASLGRKLGAQVAGALQAEPKR